jgi:hypothetical protein
MYNYQVKNTPRLDEKSTKNTEWEKKIKKKKNLQKWGK